MPQQARARQAQLLTPSLTQLAQVLVATALVAGCPIAIVW
jgi:hypothetical protein